MVTPTPPTEPEGVDPEGRTTPPYEGRRESADVGGAEEATKGGVKVGGATGPVENDESASGDPDDTPRGAVASPADEQPASEMPETDRDDDRTGPAHEGGTGRAENKP